MTNDEKVLSLLISLYKEVIDAKAKAMLALQKLDPSFPEQLEFSHEYRTAVSNEMQKAATTLKELGFVESKVDAHLTTLFGDIMKPKT